MVEQPILQKIESKDEVSSVSELLESTAEMEKLGTEKIEAEVEPEPVVSEVNTLVIEPMNIVTEVVEEIEAEEEVVEPVVVQTTSVVSESVAMDTPVVSEVKEEKVEEELQYTSIEPDQATARLELEKLTEELRKQEEQEAEVQNIALTNYEEEQEEYIKMSTSVLKNGGFYVGRYEGGTEEKRTVSANSTNTLVSKAKVYPYNWVTWGKDMNDIGEYQEGNKGAVELCQKMYSDNLDYGVKSSLIYGTQWDSMMTWIETERNVSNSATWGNYRDGVYTLSLIHI